MNWKDLPRTKDKVAIVGFHDRTRDKAPFFDPDYEIWTLNEEYAFSWVKRTDRHFQLHPRWDFSRTNNLNDPNHLLWLKNQSGECVYCKGKGTVGNENKTCPYCTNGIFTPPEYRKNIPVYMQKEWDDIHNCVKLPLSEITQAFLPGKPYYTSSISYMLGLAMLMGFKEIEFYGFDMGTTTEYHYQRANFEYWIGLAHGKGFKVSLPDSTILTGKLYGYENMHTGYRQQMEMRTFSLNTQFNDTRLQIEKMKARTELLRDLITDGHVELSDRYNDEKLKLQKREALLNFINGAKTETENLTKLYEGYMMPEIMDEEINHPAYEENQAFVNVKYVEE